jgi:ABC-type microcin C transport system permease subunit YejB
MDPKMDSGYLKPGETMQDDYDFAQALLPEEIIGIIDQLLCHEVRDLVWEMVFEADLDRWRGIWVIRLLKLSLPVCILIGYWILVLRALSRLILIERKAVMMSL